ncbi:MAG TPA: metallophosphoesterase [Gemmataceae bacterium]|jgi:hypothetical protein|nr:metallophosphoesterase [Gemmataceae bacterium]
MPEPTRLLRTLQQAIQAVRDTPGRKGRLVSLQEAGEVMVVGDLHGNVENFRKVLQKAELQKHSRRHLVLQELIHGPHKYAAGGDKSHQLLDLFAALKCQFPRQVHMLLGNHELSQWTGQAIAKVESDLNALFREGVGTAYGPHAPHIYAAYLELFAVVPLALRTFNRIFLCHSLPSASKMSEFDPAKLEWDVHDENDLRPGGSIHTLVWGRDTREETAAAFLQKVGADLLITGHIPCGQGFEAPNSRQLILDALGSPACYCLFPTDRALTQQELLNFVGTL